MSIISNLLKTEQKIKKIILGSILTGIALVIANAWGQAVKKTILLLVNKIRCEKFILSNKKKLYETCLQNEDVLGLYINAFMITIILTLIILYVLKR